MTGWRKIARIIASTILLISCNAALAQVPGMPVRQNVDDNGVDALLGSYNQPMTDLSIGPAGHGGLQLTRYWAKGGWRFSYVLTIDGNEAHPIVSIGGTSESFSATSSGSLTYTNDYGGGGSLVRESAGGDYVYTGRDGTIVRFMPNDGMGFYPYSDWIGRGRSITYPDGTVVKIYYRSDVNNSSEGRLGAGRTRISAVTNSLGYILKFSYAENGALDATNHQGWSRVTGVTAVNQASEYCDPTASSCSLTGTWPSVQYTGPTQLNVYTVQDPMGRIWNYTYGGASRLTGIRRPGPSGASDDITVTYASTSSGDDVVTRVDRQGLYEDYTYSYNGTYFITQKSGKNPFQSYFVPGSGFLAINNNWEYRWFDYYTSSDKYGLLSHSTTYSNSKSFVRDSRGNITSEVFTDSATQAALTTSTAYPATCANPVTCNKPTSTTDVMGNVTDYTYDPVHGGVTSVKSPAPTVGGVRPEVRTTYAGLKAYYRTSATGTPVASAETHYVPVATSMCRTTASCAGGADETKTTVGYGPQVAGTGNTLLPVSVAAGSGDGLLVATTATTYDDIGNPIYVDGSLPGTADTGRTLYNAARQIVGTIGPDPDGAGSMKNRAQRITYGLDGQQTRIEAGTTVGQTDTAWAAFQPLTQVDTDYDALGRKIKDTASAGGSTYAVTQYSYLLWWRYCTAVRMNPATWNSQPNACDATTSGSYGLDRISAMSPDSYGRPTMIYSGFGTADQSIEYRSYLIGGPGTGNLGTVTDGEGNVTRYSYDKFGRLAKTSYPSPTTSGDVSTTDYTESTYDANGNVLTERLRDGQVIGSSYDNLNRKVYEDRSGIGIDQDVTYSYDLQGKLLTASDAGGQNNSYSYDALGRMLSEANTYGGTHWSQYDLAGRRTRLSWPDGFYVDYDHLVTGEVSAIRENGATSGVGVLASYAYNDLGKRTSLTRGNGTVTAYGYDAASRLTSLAHDLAGGAYDVTTTFAYNPASQLASSTRDNDAYAWTGHYNVDRPYTVNGLNQLTSAGAVSLGYDGRGNLTSSGSDSYTYDQRNQLSGMPGVPLAYDTRGRLNYVHSSPVATRLSYDGANLIAEYSHATGALTRRYVHGPGADEPLVWYEGSGTGDRRFLHADERGSIVAGSNAGGAAIYVNSYDEYGIPKSTNLGRFQYTGQAWIPELGLYNYKARMYSPTLGRFLQSDPIGYGDGMNIYAYVGGDPVNKGDPSGTDKQTINENIDSWGLMARYGSSWEYETSGQVGPVGGGGHAYGFIWATDGSSTGKTGPVTHGLSITEQIRLAQNYVGSIDLSERVSNIQDNWLKGKAGEDRARLILKQEGYVIIGEQVHIRASSGLRIIDFLALKGKVLSGWEAKTGFFAQRSSFQMLKDLEIERKGGVVVSRGALGGGLFYGQKITYATGVISLLD